MMVIPQPVIRHGMLIRRFILVMIFMVIPTMIGYFDPIVQELIYTIHIDFWKLMGDLIGIPIQNQSEFLL